MSRINFALSLAASAALGAAVAIQLASPAEWSPAPVKSEGTFSAVMTANDGNTYVMDSGLTAGDCLETIRFQFPSAACERD